MTAAPSPPPQALLRVGDPAASLAFYCRTLGFACLAHDPAGGTALVEGPGGARLVLAAAGADLSPWPGVPRSGPGAWVYLHRPCLAGLAAELAARGATGLRGPVEPYPGLRRLQLDDPDGYVIEFWEPVELTDAEVVDLYAAGPARLDAALAGLAEADLELPRGPGKWTIRQIVHHLVDADLGTFQVIRMALAEPGRTMQPNVWDPDTAAAGLGYVHRPVGPAAALLAAARAWVLDGVACLPGALDRYVTWPSGHRAVVRDLMRQVGGHALHHIAQIAETRLRHGRA